MEPIFENRYHCNKKMLAEFARKYSVGPTPRMTVITLPVVILAAPVLLSKHAGSESKLILWIAVAILIGAQFLPQFYAHSTIANMKKQNDGVLPETIVVFGDENIQMFEGMVHLTIEYRKIVKTVRLKNSYALMTGKRTAVLVQENGFTRGSFAVFREFIRNKCPGVEVVE